jgi:CO/xanthine dehydrogenase Mo-binding subunit
VLTHEDVPDVRYGQMVKDRLMFARDRVRFEGDIVAAVAAQTPELAARAAAAIDVEYEPLPAVSDLEAALADDAPLIHEEWESYEADEQLGRNRNVLGYSTVERGDADAAMEGADVVVKARYVTDSSQGAPIEPRAILAQWQGDRVTVWSSTQVPFAARSGVAEVLEIPESHVRVVVPLLGGGFGSKCDFHFEGHVAALARAARRPIKLVFTREEEFVAPDHRREGMVIELETGARSDGTLVARRGRLILDGGAYCGEGGFFAQLAAMRAVGPYVVDNVKVESTLVYTNNQPSGSIRAPTAPQVCWALEQHMDEVAEALGLDPVELRRRTLVEEGDAGPTHQVYGPLAIKETLERAIELVAPEGELPEDEAIGVACGWWPSFGGNSGAYVKLNADGTGVIVTGAQENGSGAVMALPLLAAEELGLDPGSFSILYQDTDAGPYDGGSSGSQTTFNNGRAVVAAAREVRDKLLELASEKLEIAAADLELAEGQVRVKGTPTRSIPISELAGSGVPLIGKGAGAEIDNPPCEPESGCLGRLGFESFLEPQVFTHAARVKVDRETGVVRVLHVAAVHDSGVIVNRPGADGQVYGGVVMGIGQALHEVSRLDEDGSQLNPHLLDYKLVTTADAPRIDIDWIETPAQNGGPRGSKGVGEPPTVPTPGAIANAIARVIGTRVRELPMTAERVWLAANRAR